MSESSFLEVATSIRDTIHQTLGPPQQLITHSNNTSTVEQLAAQQPIQHPYIDFAQRAASWKLPDNVVSEIMSMMPKESGKHQEVAERAHFRLLHELQLRYDNTTIASLAPHISMARDAIYGRSVNSLLGAIQQLASGVDADGGSVSGVDDEDDSETSSSEEEDDDDEDLEGAELEDADEDENTPMKPGEEVPPLETKYLPIFEALHERGKVLTKPEKTYLVTLTGMTYRQITIWFQNRRRGELKEDMHARLNTYASSNHSDQSSDLSEDDLLEKKLSMAQPSDTTFNIRSWRLASAVASGDLAPAFPPSPTKVGFTDTSISRPEIDDTDSDLSDSDDELDRSDNGARVPSLTTSSTAFDSSSDRGPATVGSASSSQVMSGVPTQPMIANEKTTSPEQNPVFARPVKQLPSSRRTTPPAAPQPPRAQQPQQPSAFNFNFAAPSANSNPPKQTVPVTISPAQPPQFVTSNERGLTVEMDTTPPRSTITLQSSSSTTPVANAASSSHAAAVSPPSPVLPNGSPNSASSPSPSGNSGSSPRPAAKPLPRRTGCAPRPRPPPRVGSVTAGAGSARSSVVLAPVVLPPSSNPSLAGTTLGALLRPNIPPPSIPPEIEERLSAMANRMGVGATGHGQRRNPSTDLAGMNRPRPAFNFGPSTLPGAGIPGNPPPGLPRGSSPRT